MSTEITSGQRVASYRKFKGLSQQQLADVIEVSRSYIGDIEAGRCEPSAKFLTSMMMRTDVSSDWILTGEGGMLRKKASSEQVAPRRGNSLWSAGEEEDPLTKGLVFLDDEDDAESRPLVSEQERAALLALFEALDAGQRREILQVAQEKKRLSEVERQLAELQKKLA